MNKQIVVRYMDTNVPDCVWEYKHDATPCHAKLLGYWIANDEKNPNKRNYVEIKNQKNLILMDYDSFVTTFIENKKLMKTYNTLDEFMGDLFLNRI